METFLNILQMIGETIGMTFISTAIAYLFGIPLGVLLNISAKKGLKPNKILNLIIGIVVNILRSVPCLIVVVICMPWTRAWTGKGSGEWYTILIPLSVCALGYVARVVEQSLNEVPAEEIEGIKSLGATNWQIITKVLIPEAKSSLITGCAVTAVSIIGYTSFAYNIGAGGLIAGVYTYFTRHTGDYMGSWYFWLLIVIVVAIVQIIQELGLYLAKKTDKRRKLK